MSKREISGLGAAAATQPRKRGAEGFDAADCDTWSRTKLQLHQRWEDGTLPADQHASVDQGHHQTWTRWTRRGGLTADVQELPPRTSGRNLQREMAAQTAAVVSSGPTIPEMMKDRPRWWRDLNALLRSAALLYGDIYVDNTGECPTCIAIARRVKQFYDFDLRTIRKAGEAVLKNS